VVKGVGLAVSAALVILWVPWLMAGTEPSFTETSSTNSVTRVSSASIFSSAEADGAVRLAQAAVQTEAGSARTQWARAPQRIARVPEFASFHRRLAP
jgi:hypothetical protein